jgi:transposase InsO family protein
MAKKLTQLEMDQKIADALSEQKRLENELSLAQDAIAVAQAAADAAIAETALAKAAAAAAKAPPQPPPPKPMTEQVSTPILIDIPCSFLSDRLGWPDFKKALNECGLSWGLPEWMTTIVHCGAEWNSILKTGTDLSQFFPVAEKKQAGDGSNAKTSALGAKLTTLLGLPKNMGESIGPSVQFCCLSTVEFESERRLPARQKMWSWMVRSLRGNKTNIGPFHYLVDEVQMYDIALLFKRLVEVLEQITICSLDDELENVIKMDYNPQKQNVFSYLGDLRKAIKRLHELGERLPIEGRIVLPDSYVRSRLVRAARLVPVYKPVIDALLILPMEEWATITSDALYHQLEAVCANELSVYAPNHAPTDGLTANAAYVKPNGAKPKQDKQEKKSSPGPCFAFAKGACSRDPCRFSHAPEQKKVQSHSSQSQSQSNKCNRCGGSHNPKECNVKTACTWCGKIGHLEQLCNSKKANKPKAYSASAEGGQLRCNVVIVSPPAPVCFTSDVSSPPPPPDCVTERFYADTGANRSIHPNGRSAMSFYRLPLDIATATSGKPMRSEGVGKMLLYAPNGNPFPGFDNVVFARCAAEKLASVGDLCDAGMVCVFTKDGLRTYKATDYSALGEVFTYDGRCKKTNLYPLTLHRKAKERNMVNVQDFSLDFDLEKIEKKIDKKFFLSLSPNVVLPDLVPDAEALPTALLARTYIKEGLSLVDRLHAKCGDMGVKDLKKAFPSLVVPKKYRCEFCIDGKIHKFGHGPCKPGQRTEYEPGVCIHSDHSGPYARTLGGSRYSQLYLDRGSGYLWACRMPKKTGHYTETPKIFVDSQALSGRPVQIFHSDGDGVFSSKETQDFLLREKIRHEYSAPYDSNTNPFVERARRTIFEGVCTALLRSGAPASFWGEAEAHKIFTMNVMPTIPDEKKAGNFISRQNLLLGVNRPFNLDHLMAFGTQTTCYVPVERRKGGKHPAQRRSFKGAILGYVDGMPAYRVWDFESKTIRSVSFNFTICHEGYYPFKDPSNWPPECLADPSNFSPVIDGVLSTTEWKKYGFDAEDTNEVFSAAPGLR